MTVEVKIRFNTDKDKLDSRLSPWRILVNGTEHLADSVQINTTSKTTLDEISPGKLKWHISCFGRVVWDQDKKKCTILPLNEGL